MKRGDRSLCPREGARVTPSLQPPFFTLVFLRSLAQHGVQGSDFHPPVIVSDDILGAFSLMCEQIGPPLAHADAVAVTLGSKPNPAAFNRPGKIGGCQSEGFPDLPPGKGLVPDLKGFDPLPGRALQDADPVAPGRSGNRNPLP